MHRLASLHRQRPQGWAVLPVLVLHRQRLVLPVFAAICGEVTTTMTVKSSLSKQGSSSTLHLHQEDSGAAIIRAPVGTAAMQVALRQ